MIVKDMVIELFKKSGNHKDVDPYNVVAEVATYTAGNAGWIEAVKYINRAYMKLSAWKMPTGTMIRFREHNQVIFFQVQDQTTVAITAVSSNPANILTFGTATFTVDFYKGWYLTVGSESHMIISNTATTITFDSAWTTDSASLIGETATLFKRWFPIRTTLSPYPAGQAIIGNDSKKLLTPIKIKCLGSVTQTGSLDQEVFMADRTMPFYDRPETRTYPGLYRHTSRGIEFDTAPLDDTVYTMEFWGEPEQFDTTNTIAYATVDAQTPDLPSSWHEILWRIGAWLFNTLDGDTDDTNNDKRIIDNLIATTIQEHEHLYDMSDGYVYIDMSR